MRPIFNDGPLVFDSSYVFSNAAKDESGYCLMAMGLKERYVPIVCTSTERMASCPCFGGRSLLSLHFAALDGCWSFGRALLSFQYA